MTVTGRIGLEQWPVLTPAFDHAAVPAAVEAFDVLLGEGDADVG